LGERYLESHTDLPATVFVGVGALEEVGPEMANFRMVTNVSRLESMLRAKRYPGLTLSTMVFPGESHTTVVGMNLVRGLVSVFGRPAPSEGLMAKYAEFVKQSRPR
jgi:hypothetical protein